MADDAKTNLLDKRHTAKMLSISERTLDNWVKEGRIAYVKLGYVVRFLPDDVYAFISSRRVNKR